MDERGLGVLKFYISDIHIGHKNILTFDNRPFFTLEEMRDCLIANWNSRVTKNDEVYILGDMFWHNDEAPGILSELKGRKYLILGNHDRVNAEMAKHFVWCDTRLEYIKDEGQKVVLCHYPIAHWDGQDHTPQTIHLYGHIHQGRDARPFEKYVKLWEKTMGMTFKAANVGCMMPYMDYTPRTLEEIKKAKGW